MSVHIWKLNRVQGKMNKVNVPSTKYRQYNKSTVHCTAYDVRMGLDSFVNINIFVMNYNFI